MGRNDDNGDEFEYGDLYDGDPPHEDVDTSIGASKKIKRRARSIRERVYRWGVNCGWNGFTDDECEGVLGLRHQTASARRRELVLEGRMEWSGRYRPTRSGTKARVWTATILADEG